MKQVKTENGETFLFKLIVWRSLEERVLFWTEDLRVGHRAFSVVLNQSDSLCHFSLCVFEVRTPGFRAQKPSPPAGFALYQQVIICPQPSFKALWKHEIPWNCSLALCFLRKVVCQQIWALPWSLGRASQLRPSTQDGARLTAVSNLPESRGRLGWVSLSVALQHLRWH